jgi:hypothetical protein
MNGQSIHLVNESQGYAVVSKTIWPWCKANLHAGRPVVLEARLAEDVKTDKQRRFLHGFILASIAQQARPNGQQFPLAVWKEHFRSEFLGCKAVTTTNPLTCERVVRSVRVSTEDLGVKGYSEYIDRVAAFAATELGVEFMEEYVDPSTGEVFNLSTMRGKRNA